MFNEMRNTTAYNSTMTDDNQAYWIEFFVFLNKTASQYGMGLIWLVGNIGSVFTCIVFYQPAFRNNPCAMYFSASSLSQFFAFNFALLTRILQYGHYIQIINTVLWFCKFRFYLFYIFVAVSRYNVILASIDRYFASSRDALRRQWSSKKIAIRLIIGNAIFWSLMYIQVLIFYEIQYGQCQPRIGVYGMFFSIYISIDSGIFPLSLLFIFGWLTVRNVHQTKQRIRPIAMAGGVRLARAAGMSNKDSQLQKMLANQIFLFIILNILNPCYLVYQAFTINIDKTPVRLTIELLVSNMTYALVYLGFALTFVTFLLTSKMFRREFQLLIQTKLLRRPTPFVAAAITPVRAVRGINAAT